MDLYLVRHAIAEDQADTGDDDRALTEAGRAKMIRVTQGLRKLKVRPDLILTSPLRRAREIRFGQQQRIGRLNLRPFAGRPLG